MKHDYGAVELNAVLLLVFIVAIITGGMLYTASAMKYERTHVNEFDERLEADKLLSTIIEEMQPLRFSPYDDTDNITIAMICLKYKSIGLEFTDVSSGYHLDFLSDKDLMDSNIANYIFLDNTGIGFISWRNTNGLTVSKNNWREFIKEEALDSCVSYGWLHNDDTDSFAYEKMSKTFAVFTPNDLFPLMNGFPRMNVNMVKPEILYPIIQRYSGNIDKSKDKADALINKLRNGPILHSDIASTLAIPVNHPLMGYMGTKTAFWKLRFAIRPMLIIEAIVAAIPKKGGNVQEIESYRLIDRSFFDV